jgi:hypothetical protein
MVLLWQSKIVHGFMLLHTIIFPKYSFYDVVQSLKGVQFNNDTTCFCLLHQTQAKFVVSTCEKQMEQPLNFCFLMSFHQKCCDNVEL